MTHEDITNADRREGQVLDAVRELVDSLLHDFDVIEMLTHLCERCVDLLDIAAAGLLLADPTKQLRLMAATSDKTRDLELLQLQADEGPCLQCYATGRPVTIADVRADATRWPRFVEAATDAGFVSVQAVPMRAAGVVLGALGLFGSKAGALRESDMVVGQTLAHVATVAIMQGQAPSPTAVPSRLVSALTSRIVVEQAKGLVRGRLGVSVDDAFTLLRRYAEDNGAHLTDVARRLVSDRAARPGMLEELGRSGGVPRG